MKARLGTVLPNEAQMSRGLPQGAPESPVTDLVKSWKVRNLAWSLDDFVLAANCYVFLVAASVAAAEVKAQSMCWLSGDVPAASWAKCTQQAGGMLFAGGLV